jgi:hypothetical protein
LHWRDDKVCSILFRPTSRRLAALYADPQLKKARSSPRLRHREGRFNLDDREMLSQARNLASRHGYTVLQAVQEWHSSKGSSEGMPLGKVIEKFLDAKSNRSPAYMDKLTADMRLLRRRLQGCSVVPFGWRPEVRLVGVPR